MHPSSSDIYNSLVAGDRAALAKAITVVESRNPAHHLLADELVQMAIQLKKPSIRIGITGIPGVGKSTFIDGFGAWLVKNQHKKVCVLAIDPSSYKSHGSILGDKTRMERLSMMENAFVRPSSAAGNLGGVARKTRETILLCEAAGYDTIIVETVGVGQSEYVADSVVDCLILLLLPNAGDELQGIKRGIMELADIVVFNKSDVTEKVILNQSLGDVKNALHLLPDKFEGWKVPVLSNALDSPEDASLIWKQIEMFLNHQKSTGYFDNKRSTQRLESLKEAVKDRLESTFFNNPIISQSLDNALNDWMNGRLSLTEICTHLVDVWKKS